MQNIALKGIFAVVCLTALWSCKPTRQQALEYSEKIINQQKAIHRREQQLIASLEDSTAVQTAYYSYMRQVQVSLDSVLTLGAFDDDPVFREAAVKLFIAYRTAGDNEYREVVDIMKRSDASLSDVDKEYVRQLLYDVRQKLNREVAQLDSVQEDFAKRYDIELEEIKENK